MFLACFIILFVVGLGVAVFIADKALNTRARPLSLQISYVLYFVGGLWGWHSFYQRRFWEGSFKLVLTLIISLLNYGMLKLYWNSLPQLFSSDNLGSFTLFLIVLLLISLLTDLICIPYFNYRFNNKYYRRHFETDDILNGQQIEVEKFCYELSAYLNDHLNVHLEELQEVLSDDDWELEDETEETGFWTSLKNLGKNILTLGKHSTLKHKIARLRLLQECCVAIKIEIENLKNFELSLESYLEDARKASFRNLYLAKELIAIGKKKMKGRRQKIVNDNTLTVGSLKKVKISSNIEVDYSSDRYFSNLSGSLDSTFFNLRRNLDKNENPSDSDVIAHMVEFGVEALGDTIKQIGNINAQTNNALREAEKQISNVLEYIDESLEAITLYQASFLQQLEVLVALTKCYKAFIIAYEPLRENIFGTPGVIRFLLGNKELNEYTQGIEFKKDIQHLMLLCSEYNKINNSTIIKENG